MKQKKIDQLPQEIQKQIEMLLSEEGQNLSEEKKELYAELWHSKYKLFVSQIQGLGMENLSWLARDDKRAALLLTFSGSLIGLGPLTEQGRSFNYYSVKFRTDVPASVSAASVQLADDIKEGHIASFENAPIRQSSAIYKIAVFKDDISTDDQILRLREAITYLTNGFVKINRTINPELSSAEQLTTKAIISQIAKENDITQKQAKKIIEDYLSLIETGMLLGEKVRLGRLGKLQLRVKAAQKARMGRNPATGEEILIPAKPATPVPVFRPSSYLKERAGLTDPAFLGIEEETSY
ncbi:HU family DNA-binding protein [Spirochaetia bacterium 38H-sp]|uniref:HU family DNA-binding protein n=1 Tax=Rarispira pelagica TaxID=3141764 RepID=A0ABU9UDM4_9SPIR